VDFYPVDGTGRNQVSTTTVRVADRAAELSHFSGIKSVGLLPLSRPAGFVVAELQVVEHPGRRAANLIWFHSVQNSWNEVELTCPDVTPGASAEWMPHDVIAYDSKLWWVDLSRGFLVCNPADPMPHLSFVSLPDLTGEMFVGLEDRHEGLEGIDSHRIVRVSGGELRFVDVVRRHGEPPEATRVVVWTLDTMFDPSTGRARWEHHQCMTTLAAIWDHPSYVESGMPRGFPRSRSCTPTSTPSSTSSWTSTSSPSTCTTARSCSSPASPEETWSRSSTGRCRSTGATSSLGCLASKWYGTS